MRRDARYSSVFSNASTVILTSLLTVQSIEEWAAPRIQTFPFASLRHAVIGIDASYYLDLRLNSPTSIEPLLSAIGGVPYTLKATLRGDLEAFQAIDATLIFVFDGLDYKNKEQHNSTRLTANLKAYKDGWKEYYNKDNDKKVAAERTLKAFAKASAMNDSIPRYLADGDIRLSSWKSDQTLPIAAESTLCAIHSGSI